MPKRKRSTIGRNPLDQFAKIKTRGKRKVILKDPSAQSQVRELIQKSPRKRKNTLKQWFKSVLGRWGS
ncbi:MAG: hypothetical protein HY399_02370 [Elusimicrobia bacterium]|nr:hypothetical protein [Elusimicrobiota bacterium]